MEHANDDEKTYYIIDSDPIINSFISVPKDKGSLNCAAFMAGIIEAVLVGANFSAQVSAGTRARPLWSSLMKKSSKETK